MRLAFGVATLLLLCPLAVGEAAIQVQLEGDRLTLNVENAPLQDVLKAVADAGRFSLYLKAPLTDRVSAQFNRRPLLDALEWLLRDQNMLIRYSRDRGVLRIEEVQVLASSTPPRRAEAGERREASGLNPPGVRAKTLEELMLSPDAPASERIDAATAMADTPRAEAGQAVLVDILRTHKSAEVRMDALGGLTAFETIPVEPVSTAALRDPDPSVRLRALTLLGDMAETNPQARTALERVASQDADSEVRETAKGFLEDLRSQGSK